MRHTRSLLKNARQIHLYLGVFTTPALLFFAITGALQTFSFHETTKGSDYKPPKILVELGQLHKKQTLVVPDKKPQPTAPTKSAADKPAGEKHDNAAGEKQAGERPAGDKPASDSPAADKPGHDKPGQDKPAGENSARTAPEAKPKNLLPMKFFFFIVSLSLVTSTLTGLYMSYKFVRNKVLITATMLAGFVIPVLLTLF
jgi:hypothetical protein